LKVIDDEMRELIEKRWPWLLDKIPPKKPLELVGCVSLELARQQASLHGVARGRPRGT
jgi:hypothetical protein